MPFDDHFLFSLVPAVSSDVKDMDEDYMAILAETTIPIFAILKAADYAAKAHVDQRRKTKNHQPYINHPLGVALYIAQIGKEFDYVTLISALLHDTVEDTNVTLDDIEREFGSQVRNIVGEVSDDKRQTKSDRKRHQVETAPTKSYEAKVNC